MKRNALATLAALMALNTASSANAWCRTTTSDKAPKDPTSCVTEGIPLWWNRRCQTFSLDVRAGGGLSLAQMRTSVTAAFNAWNDVSCSIGPVMHISEGQEVLCDHAEYSSTDGNSNAVAIVSDFAERLYPSDALAMTVIWHDRRDGEIYDADILVNAAFAPFARCPDTGCPIGSNRYDLQNVVTHEVGHFLGLSHSADEDATMYYRAVPSEIGKRSLEQDDVDGYCDIYGDSTVPAECDPTPRHGFDADCTGEETKVSRERGCGCALSGAPTQMPTLGAGLFALVLAMRFLGRGRASSRRR